MKSGISIRCRVAAEAKTGAEMEALTGAALAALTVYDMVKSVERGLRSSGSASTTAAAGKAAFSGDGHESGRRESRFHRLGQHEPQERAGQNPGRRPSNSSPDWGSRATPTGASPIVRFLSS